MVDDANGNNFTQTGTALTTVNDRFNTVNDAIGLNGDYLTRSDFNWGPGADHKMSLSFWVKTDTNSSDIKTIINDRNSSDYGYYIYLRDGKIGLSTKYRERHYGNGSYTDRTQGLLASSVIADNSWHHVVATIEAYTTFNGSFDSATIRLRVYIDDALVGSNDQYHSYWYFNIPINVTGNVKIASNANNNLAAINQYQDEIDDILFYNRIITTAEITQIGTVNSFCFPLTPSEITISNNTETSFDVSWPKDGDFELAYVLSGQPISSATVIPVNGYTSGTLQNITGLTSSTFYDVYLREKCSPTIWSAWSSPLTTRTRGVIYVNANATGNNDGSSFVNGYTDLQDALAISEIGQEIWMAQGTYHPDASDKTVSYVINKADLKIYGGFNGTETQLSDRDLTANYETILSGDLNNDDTGVAFSGTNRGDNTEAIIKDNAENFLLDGITISDGHTTTYGAGLIKSNAVDVMTVKNCKFINNVSTGSCAGINIGVGTTSKSTVHIDNSIFKNNLARHGTAVYMVNSGWRSSVVNITNSLFDNNTAKDNGGTKGYAGSAGWFRTTYAATNNSTVVNLTNNTYVNNKDEGTANTLNNFNRATVGITNTGSNTTTGYVSNCIFWGNTTVGGVTAKSIAEIHTSLGDVSVYNSIGEDGFSNLTNLLNVSSSDPLFTDAATNDFTLQSGSPAVDAGDNSKLPASAITDLVGNVRIFNTTVDMGPYEYGASTPANYTLTTNATNGSVSNNPSGSVFVELTSVELTAIPDSGYQFSHWSGDATGTTNPLTITMDSDKNITAEFILEQHTLTITAVNGTVTTNPNPVGGTYDHGTSVVLTATPDPGFQFDSWSGDITGNSLTETIVMDADKSVTANFIEGPVFVDLNATGNNNGTSWADAYTSLQTAISNTGVAKDIWVAKGTYVPAGSGRNATFSVNKKQRIYGGFAGFESSLADRDYNLLYTTNATILSGDLNGDDNGNIIQTEATRQDNAYHVVTAKGNYGTGGELNGFIITGGNSNGGISNNCSTSSTSQYDRRVGAAIYANPDGANYKVYLKVVNCKIEKNTGTYYAVLGRFSPCGDQGTQYHVDITNCEINDNYSASSANIGYTGNQQYNIRAYGKIVNSLITNNSTGAADKSSALIILSGGGSGSNPAALVSVINTTISKNSSANNRAVTINLRSASSYPVYFFNTIVYDNGGTSSFNVLGTNGTSAAFSNNIVEGGQYSSDPSNPMFVDAVNSNFTLQPSSPAIDSGDNTRIPSGVTIDLTGGVRINNSTVDIGAYEFGNILDVSDFTNEELSLSIYPNPTRNVLNISTVEKLEKVEVYNYIGQKVLESRQGPINVSNFNSGMYLLKVYTAKGGIAVKRFIKQ